ncbi:ComEA family DNA-binding protein [Enterococcus cecorum]|uniref:ComEA family DNA-binding protein n=1 Tax=Enterococcus cecorum TaxID=44008 RepID=UPI001FAC8142|nr:ComEA family DNA-binding protein [Enterococcus cecorum]MCJ0537026.1 ComEA family DNA-binding protein [Enterococcus cecorum]MCJ0544806.1 ComEA family DNA-binding protein [Enterococcus cecorum]MCJ0550392.1 ComEA family DNA-binding protein [Enterococcus cecorum]MCJ0570005.1 ComEA family DNA-binding protein [Enterococcus cecorum]
MQNWWRKIKTWQLVVGVCGIVLLGIAVFLLVTQQEKEDKELLIETSSTTEVTTDTKMEQEQANDKSKSSKIYVDISGAVKQPGVYQLSEGARLFDLLKQAGGLTEDAAIQTVNQAMIIQDQQKIIILTQDQAESLNTESINNGNLEEKSDGKSPKDAEKLNINQADLTQLQQLSGIGEKKAQAIIDYRNENGSFKTIEDLAKVTGIGEKTVEKLRDSITI